jgi:hypothetical protein
MKAKNVLFVFTVYIVFWAILPGIFIHVNTRNGFPVYSFLAFRVLGLLFVIGGLAIVLYCKIFSKVSARALRSPLILPKNL